MFRSFAAVITFAITVHSFAADEKFKVDDLVGIWAVVKSPALPAGGSAVFTFAKDGTVKTNSELMGMKFEYKGTWKLDGDKLAVTVKDDDMERIQTATIIELTTDKLVTKNKQGKQDEFKRVKEEKK